MFLPAPGVVFCSRSLHSWPAYRGQLPHCPIPVRAALGRGRRALHALPMAPFEEKKKSGPRGPPWLARLVRAGFAARTTPPADPLTDIAAWSSTKGALGTALLLGVLAKSRYEGEGDMR